MSLKAPFLHICASTYISVISNYHTISPIQTFLEFGVFMFSSEAWEHSCIQVTAMSL